MKSFREFYLSEYGKFVVEANNEYITKVYLDNNAINEMKNDLTSKVVKQLDEYFNNGRIKFDLPLYFPDNFYGKVWAQLYNVEYAKTLTYKELGELVNSKAYRAIGTAMAKNPFAIIVPCHRIVRSGGDLGNYFYGVKMKKSLLINEYSFIFNEKCLETKQFSSKDITKLKNIIEFKEVFKTIELVDSYKYYKDLFHVIISQIIYQQINFNTAKNIELLFFKYYNFNPTATLILNTSAKQFKNLGINKRKAECLKSVADLWISSSTMDEFESNLIQISGIGKWTMKMYELFGKCSESILSFEDLIIYQTLLKLYNVESLSDEQKSNILKQVSGIETLTSINLWKYAQELRKSDK